MRRERRTRMLGVVLLAAVVAALILPGCGGVLLSAEYDELLDRTCALADETAERAEAGELSPEQMAQALRKQAGTWRLFQQARDGQSDDTE